MTGGGRVGDLIRHTVFPRMQNLRLPGTRVSAADGVAPGLRSSGLVIKSRTPGGLAGTLCPNPVLGDGLRFDEVVGNRFALITSSPLTDAQRNELRSRGAVVVPRRPRQRARGLAAQRPRHRGHRAARPRGHAGGQEHPGAL